MKRGSRRGKDKCKKADLLLVLMIICVLLSLTTLGIVAYDKYIKADNTTCSPTFDN